MTESKNEHIGDVLAQALLDHTPRGLYLRAVRAEAAYKRAHQQANDALNEAARLQRERDEQKRRADEAERMTDDVAQQIADMDERVAAAERLADALERALVAIGGLPDGFCVCPKNRDPLRPEDEHTGECRDARAALTDQPAEQPETLEAQGHKARGKPLADHPAKHMEKE